MDDDEYVVDTGVFVRWYIEQVGFEHALEARDAFLKGTVALETVDFVRIEFGNVLRKVGFLRGVLERDEYLAACRSLDDLDVVIHPTDTTVLERVASLAVDRNISFFDALLVDLSLERGIPILTADQRLCRAVAGFAKTTLLRGVATT